MSKRILFLALITSIGVQQITAQNYLEYYKTINKAEIANLDKNYEISASLYKTAFGLVRRPFKEDYLFAAIVLGKLENEQKSYEYLVKGIKNGLTLKRIKKQYSSFKKSEKWKVLKQEYDKLRQEHLNNLNQSLRSEIVEMIKKDQKARAPIFGSWKQMNRTDKYNYNRLIEIIEKNGKKWPGFSTIGEITPEGKYNVTENITLMPLHFKKEEIENLKPYMLQAVLDGEMYPYQYARIIDYTIGRKIPTTKEDMENGVGNLESCYFYGAYLNVKICDCKTAEIERKKIGFEPIEDFYRKFNSDYECIDRK